MLQLGFSPTAITEAAFLIVNHCFMNRVATFLACPPVVVYERLGRSILGRLLRPMLATANRRSVPVPTDFKLPEGAPFAEITNTLSGLPAAYLLHEALTGAFDSPVLSRRIKALMFGVVARMLDCRFCLPHSVRLLQAEGFDRGGDGSDPRSADLAEARSERDRDPVLGARDRALQPQPGPEAHARVERGDRHGGDAGGRGSGRTGQRHGAPGHAARMTTAVLLWLAGAGALLGLLAFVAWQRRQIRQLERLVDDTHGRLEQLQLHFARFAPDDVVEQLTEKRGEVKASRRMVTVLFADLKGFTALCDRLDSEQMVPILNGYFRYMSQAITAHHGRVTELTGDGLLALFGALEPNPWQAQDAVLGALAMREALATLQRDVAGALAAGAGAGHRHPSRRGRGRRDGQRGAQQVRRGRRHDQRRRARGAVDA